MQRIEASIARHVDFSPSGDGWLGIPELPAAEELLRQQWEVRDPPENDVTKPYSSKEKYLEALHGILRVEGTEGLRYAVNKVRENPEMMDDGSIAIYTEVSILLLQNQITSSLTPDRFEQRGILLPTAALSAASRSRLVVPAPGFAGSSLVAFYLEL